MPSSISSWFCFVHFALIPSKKQGINLSSRYGLNSRREVATSIGEVKKQNPKPTQRGMDSVRLSRHTNFCHGSITCGATTTLIHKGTRDYIWYLTKSKRALWSGLVFAGLNNDKNRSWNKMAAVKYCVSTTLIKCGTRDMPPPSCDQRRRKEKKQNVKFFHYV